ncbi:hypothetical protein Vafri_8464 [Volvox africanus]|nr:hypothetical protein Vafri_8464 [Volvox africanus]
MTPTIAWKGTLTSKDTRGQYFTDFLVTWAAWLLSMFVRLLPAFLGALRTGCYLWPRRYNNYRSVLRYTFKPHFLPTPSSSWSTWSSPVIRVSLAHPELWELVNENKLNCLKDRIFCLLKYDAGYSGAPRPHVQAAVPRFGKLNSCRTSSAGEMTPTNSVPWHGRLSAGISSYDRSPRHLQSQVLFTQQGGGKPITAPAPVAAADTAAASSNLYGGCTTAFSIRYKIHGYEPSDLRPDWRTRLDSLTYNDVTCLMGSYVRPGCVELTVDFLVPVVTATTTSSEKAAMGCLGFGAAGLGSVGCGQHSVKPPVHELAAALSPTGLAGGADGTLDVCVRGKVTAADVVQILDALGLNDHTGTEKTVGPAPPAPEDSPASPPMSTLAKEQVEVEVLGTEPAAINAPRVVHLWPRVLTLPSPPSLAGCVQMCRDMTLPPPQQQQAQAQHEDLNAAPRRPVGPQPDAFDLEAAVWGSEEDDEEDDDGPGATPSPPAAADGKVLLRATLSRPAGHHHREGRMLGVPAVFARTHNEILAAKVLRLRQLKASAPQPSCDGMGPHGQDCGAACACDWSSSSSSSSASASCDVEQYELEVLLDLPRCAGLVLVEFQWNGQPGHLVPLISISADDAAVASELQSLAGAAAAVAAPSSTATNTDAAAAAVALNATYARRRQQFLDSFLLDAGVWAAAAAAAQTQPLGGLQAAQASSSPAVLSQQLHPRQRALLGTNLLRFAMRSGLRATEAWLMQGLAELQLDLADVEARGKCVGMDGLTTAVCNGAVFATAAAEAATDCGNPKAIDVTTSCRVLALASASLLGSSTMKAGLLPTMHAAEDSCGSGSDGGAATAAKVDERPITDANENECEPRRRHLHTTYRRTVSPAANTPTRNLSDVQASGCSSAVSQGSNTSRRFLSPATAAGPSAAAAAAAATIATVAETSQFSGWADWRRALFQVLYVRAVKASEEAEYRAYAAPWTISQEHVIQTFEILVLLTRLFRARADVLNPANVTALLGGLPGLASLAAYLLLPKRAWQRVAVAIKVPRYMTYMAAKALSVVLNLPLPPGMSSYQLGIGMVLHEGLLLPLACLLPLRSAIFVTIGKVLPCMIMMLVSGVASNRRQAGLRCAAVAAVALPNTILCHTYLRVCFARWRRQRQRHQSTRDISAAAAKLQ